MISCPLCGTVPSKCQETAWRTTARCRCGSLIARYDTCTFGSTTDFMVVSQGHVGLTHAELSEDIEGQLPEDLDRREELVRDRISMAVVALTLCS